ncbi:hypothetical protein GGX14DRAFT_592775 [Mycena pura]|uniref:Uncharacterized protein n=1 Tax=Mycena pura TaxID=153505 RepID=A0AAD6YG57_9AGAR|nr:hypothetical protein GGX14DRAFT_592775 [Mycena pura]
MPFLNNVFDRDLEIPELSKSRMRPKLLFNGDQATQLVYTARLHNTSSILGAELFLAIAMQLLKFTSQDIFNATLVDVATDKAAFRLTTNIIAGPSDLARRQTEIRDGAGAVVGIIGWVGRTPHEITILDESVGGLVDLFATKTIQFIPKEISIPTRFDTEYLWTATPDSLYLLDYDSETRMAEFHVHTPSLKSMHRQISGRGATYLELSSHPLGFASDVEILVSLLMLDILRRSRFDLPPMFGPPSRLHQVWPSHLSHS